MTLNDYQASAATTDRPNLPLTYYALGLTGEAGEVADKLKKTIRDDGGTMTDAKREGLVLELGDVLWYVAALARHLGVSLDVVAEMNLAKLKDRAARGVLGGSGDGR